MRGWYFQKKKERASTRKDLGEAGSESGKTEIVELLLLFETENSVLYYIIAVENYLKPAAARRVAHSYVLEIAIRFGGWECHKGAPRSRKPQELRKIATNHQR